MQYLEEICLYNWRSGCKVTGTAPNMTDAVLPPAVSLGAIWHTCYIPECMHNTRKWSKWRVQLTALTILCMSFINICWRSYCDFENGKLLFNWFLKQSWRAISSDRSVAAFTSDRPLTDRMKPAVFILPNSGVNDWRLNLFCIQGRGNLKWMEYFNLFRHYMSVYILGHRCCSKIRSRKAL